MAKKSSVNKNEFRKKLAFKYKKRRDELRKQAKSIHLSEEERMLAQFKLQKLPYNSSFCRVRSRCYVTGRSRGNLRKFGLSRITFREMASRGEVPGVIKASW